MYKILENPIMMTRDEIKKKFDGKWIYITNCEFTLGDKIIKGIPRVVADTQGEGVDDGIYDIYSNKETYGNTISYSLLDFDYLIPTIQSILKHSSISAIDTF